MIAQNCVSRGLGDCSADKVNMGCDNSKESIGESEDKIKSVSTLVKSIGHVYGEAS